MFPPEDVKSWAAQYQVPEAENAIIELKGQVQQRGYLLQDELERVAYWKSPRSQPQVKNNEPEYIKEITQFALGTVSERARIEALTLLSGVGWPTASVILHLLHRQPYPILDFRALWSVGASRGTYDFDFWRNYTAYCRQLAKIADVDMRTLDRALWQYSKEKQP